VVGQGRDEPHRDHEADVLDRRRRGRQGVSLVRLLRRGAKGSERVQHDLRCDERQQHHGDQPGASSIAGRHTDGERPRQDRRQQ
jgi:hypothetical protein